MRIFWIFTLITMTIVGCSEKEQGPALGEIPSPADNQWTDERVALGRQLFFDKQLSINNSVSCATCHKPEKYFTDGLSVSIGVYGRKALRNAPSLINQAFATKYMADGAVPTLEMQAIIPIQDHNEMGMTMGELIRKLRKVKSYNKQSILTYQRPLDAFVITRALAVYVRSLVTLNSDFDEFTRGNSNALSPSAKRGWSLFSKKLNCTACHVPPTFSNFELLNNGLVSLDQNDLGRYRIDGDSMSIGKFKVPSLRNVAHTAPYMHNGSFKQLEDVLRMYEKGGLHTKNQDPRIRAFQLSDRETKDLVSFLHALTDR